MIGYKQLTRDEKNGIIGGVCAGIGKYINADPTILRIIWAALFLLYGSGILIYLLMWIIVPNK